ncbi:sugar ABC transporter substrate-binding protein [Mycolicibacterium baixiangningiae]|uniref:sugar ABC transporter substrate-binding protein n=1 Tax=Mycolicibacterium baixiangningiae TaxID=2761578 RepID=UPI0018D0D8FC|nr:sugar ABC transporter substrate-binding protein [Mycolicibacterium baixiangningiae]
MRRAKKFLGVLCVAAVGSALVSCSGDVVSEVGGGGDCTPSGEKVIGWDWPLSSLEIYEPFNAKVAAIAEERGYQTVTTTNDGDLQQQVSDLEAWVAQGLSAIGTYALEPSAIEPIGRRALDNCVGFVSYGTNLKNQDASVQFAWDRSGAELGINARDWATKHGGPLKALVLHDRDITAGKERDDALMAEFPGTASNVEVVSHQRAVDTASGESVTSTVLQAHPDLNIVLAYNDDVAIGARQAFINAGFAPNDPNVYIGGQDGSPSALRLLQEGGIFRASSAVNFGDLTSTVANTIVDVAEGTEPEFGPLDFEVLTSADPDQVAEFLAAYN